MDILNMLDKIRNTQGCIVYSPCGLPILSEGVDLPNDLKVFYENCGGVSFFTVLRGVRRRASDPARIHYGPSGRDLSSDQEKAG